MQTAVAAGGDHGRQDGIVDLVGARLADHHALALAFHVDPLETGIYACSREEQIAQAYMPEDVDEAA